MTSRLLNLPNTPAAISDPIIYQEINEIYKALKLIAEELENSGEDLAATLAEILKRLKREEEVTQASGTNGEYYLVCQATVSPGVALAAWDTEYTEVAALPLNATIGAIENVRFSPTGVGVVNSGGEFYFVIFDGTHLTLSAESVSHVAAEAADISLDGEYIYIEDTNIEVYKRYYRQGTQLIQAVQTVDAEGNGGGIKLSHSGEYLVHQQNISGAYYVTIWAIQADNWIDDSAYFVRASTAGLSGPYAFAWNYDDTLIACITTQAATDIQIFAFDASAPSLVALTFSGSAVVTDGSMYNNMLCWHPTENYLVVGSSYFDPQLSLYSVSGSTVTDLTVNIDTQPSATIRSVDWSADGTRVYVNASSEFIKIYEFDQDLETLTYLFTRTLYASGTAGTLVNFIPADVTVAEEVEIPITFWLWLDPSDSTYVTMSGSDVTGLLDKSGNGFDLAAPSGQEPTIETLNGLDAIRFGTGDGFAGTFTGVAPLDGDFCLGIVIKADSVTAANNYLGIFGVSTSSTFRMQRYIRSDRQYIDTAYNITEVFPGIMTYANTDHDPEIIVFYKSGTTGYVRINGVEIASETITNVSTSDLTFWLGQSNSSGGITWVGLIGEVVMNRDTDYATIESYLAAKWGISI